MSDNTITCPDCGKEAEYPVVDIGVGEQQSGPAECECGWWQPTDVEFGIWPSDDDEPPW